MLPIILPPILELVTVTVLLAARIIPESEDEFDNVTLETLLFTLNNTLLARSPPLRMTLLLFRLKLFVILII